MSIRAIFPIVIIVILNAFLLIWSAAGAASLLADENGVLENFQVLLLGLAAIVFAFGVLCGRGHIRSAAFSLCALSLLVILRELDFRNFEEPQWLIELSWNQARDILMGYVVSILIAYIFIRRREAGAWVRLFWRGDAWPLYLTIAFLAAGVTMDYFIVENSQQKFLEELFEFDAYYMLLITAIMHVKFMIKTEQDTANMNNKTRYASHGLFNHMHSEPVPKRVE